MQLVKNILFVFLLLGTASIIAQESSIDSIAKDYKLLELDKFSIQLPMYWEVDTARKMGTEFILYSPLQPDGDLFLDNVNLMLADLEGMNIDLDKFVSNTELQIQSMVTDGEIIENERIKAENSEFHKLAYSGKQGAFELTFVQHIWVINKDAYILTFTCETAQFDYYKSTANTILHSFHLK